MILQNNFKCLLLNDKQIPPEIMFSLLDDKKYNKDEHARIERREIWNKSKINFCIDIYIVVFAFLFSTVVKGRW